MLRAILGVVAGYIAMAVVVVVGLAVAFVAMGADTAFQPGTYDVSMVWILTMLGVGIIAALIGGLVCALIAKRGSKAPIALVVVVLVLGGLSAFAAINKADPGPRDGSLPWYEAANEARQPAWSAIANPVIGAVGVLIGARLRGGKAPDPAPAE